MNSGLRSAAVLLLALAAIGICAASNYIYLLDPSINSTTNVFSLRKVCRTLSPGTPRKDSMIELLAGPTTTETSMGYMKPDTEKLQFMSFSNSGTNWNVYFQKLPGHGWNGTLSIPRFVKAVTLTLKQFSNVNTVTVFVNGSSNPNNW